MTHAEKHARDWVRQNRAAIEPLMEPGYDLRKVALKELAINPATGAAKAGLPGLYIAALARRDRDCFDLVKHLLASQVQQPEAIEELRLPVAKGVLPRPSAGRGRPYRSAGRDFVLTVLVSELQAVFPELPFGANDATHGAEPATALALRALEAEGFEVLDARKPHDCLETPAHRSVETAVRRFQGGQKVPELFF